MNNMDATMAAKRLDELFAPYDRTDAPGYTVGVRKHGKTLYRRGFGMASLEQTVANAPRTRMRIGSTTKHFVSLLALMLEEEGLLDIDAPVRTYVPELRPTGDEPTVRQLMTHTSGLRCYIDLSFLSHGMATISRDAPLQIQARQTGVNYPAGERMIYCNSGYMLLTMIVERVSGSSLKQLLKERMFEPMGMADTECIDNDLDIHAGAATLHVRLENGAYRRGIFPQEYMSGDGNILSTVDDMLGWLAHLRAPTRVGSRAAWDKMLTMPRLNNGQLSSYCLGLQRTPYRGLDTIHHAGAVVGGSCQMLTVPSEELDIIILSNGGPLSPSKLAPMVIDAVLGDAILGPRASMARVEDFRGLVGARYHSASGFLLGFDEVAGQLGLKVFGHDPVPLRHNDGEIMLEFEDIAAGPLSIHVGALDCAGEAPESLLVSECGNEERLTRLPAASAGFEAELASLTGTYWSEDLAASAHIYSEDGKARMRLEAETGSTLLALEALSPDVLGWKNVDPLVGFQGVLHVDRTAGRVLGFRLDSVRTRHLAFRRDTEA